MRSNIRQRARLLYVLSEFFLAFFAVKIERPTAKFAKEGLRKGREENRRLKFAKKTRAKNAKKISMKTF